MTAHTCRTITPGCYRCELHKDEINGWIDTLVVVPRTTDLGVVHDPDCHHARRATTAIRWDDPIPGDRACTSCLPDGLPERA